MRLRVDAKDFHFTLRRRRRSSSTARDGKERLVVSVSVWNGTNGVCLVAADESLQGGGGGEGHQEFV